MDRESQESGIGSGSGNGDLSINKIFEQVIASLNKGVIDLYYLSESSSQQCSMKKDRVISAAEQMKEICIHSVNFMASKLIKQIEDEMERKNKAKLPSTFVKFFNSMSIDERNKQSSVADHSTKRIKYPWIKQDELGRGAFGIVYRAKGQNGFQFAVKEVELNAETVENLRDEIKCLTNLSHENIVSCYGHAEGNGYLYMFLELLQGSLRDVIKKAGAPLTADRAQKYTVDIVKGLAYLHSKKVIHRDIKCANILLDCHNKAKLGDMGLSKPHDLDEYNEAGGSICWRSPETFSENRSGRRGDVWSLGCTVYEMVKGYPPFGQSHFKEFVIAQICLTHMGELKHRHLIEGDNFFKGNMKSFLTSIFVQLENRPFADDVAQHRWLLEF